MRSGHIKQLKKAQAYLKEHFGVEYSSLQGLSDMIKRRSIADMMAERAKAKVRPLAPPSGAPPSDKFVDEARVLLFDQASNSLSVPAWTDV